MIDRRNIEKAQRAAAELEEALGRLARSPAWSRACLLAGEGPLGLRKDARELKATIDRAARMGEEAGRGR